MTELAAVIWAVPMSTVCAGTCSTPSSAAQVSMHPTLQAVRLGVGYNF